MDDVTKQLADKDWYIGALKKDIEELTYKLRHKEGHQATNRTLVDCMNHYILANGFTLTAEIMARKCKLILKKDGDVIHETAECYNLQCAYEELTEWLVEKALGV